MILTVSCDVTSGNHSKVYTGKPSKHTMIWHFNETSPSAIAIPLYFHNHFNWALISFDSERRTVFCSVLWIIKTASDVSGTSTISKDWYLGNGWEELGEGTLALTLWSPWTATWRKKGADLYSGSWFAGLPPSSPRRNCQLRRQFSSRSTPAGAAGMPPRDFLPIQT